MKRLYFFLLVLCIIIVKAEGTPSYCSQESVSNLAMGSPEINCPDDITVYTTSDSCMAYVPIPQPIVNSSCEEYVLVNDYTLTDDASAVYITGTTIITWTVTDTCGEASCSMQVSVIDTIPPTIYCISDTSAYTNSHFCGANLNIPIPSVTDNCEVFELWNDYTFISDASGEYNLGTTEVTWYASDVFNNIGSCLMLVHIEDNDPPIINCPNDTIVYIHPDSNFVYVEIPQAEVFDNCEVDSYWNDYTLTNDASGVYHRGETVVIWTVTDVFENENICTMIVEVTSETSIIENVITDVTFRTDLINGKLVYTCESQKPVDIKLQIFDMMGRELFSEISSLEKGKNHKEFSMKLSSGGIYAVRLSLPKQKITKLIFIH